MNEVVVGIAEGRVVQEPDILVTYALGSCVGVCLYDRISKIAGLAHIVLPYAESGCQDKTYKYADTGIALLLHEMEKQGARKERITAKVAGGAEMFKSVNMAFDIGNRNILAVRQTLGKLGIPVKAEDTGAHHGRTLLFYAADGKVEVRNIRYGTEFL